MKEIYACQNYDGTYTVEIRDTFKTVRTIGRESFVTTNEGKTIIPRADIQIIAYTSKNPDSEICTLTVNVDSKQ